MTATRALFRLILLPAVALRAYAGLTPLPPPDMPLALRAMPAAARPSANPFDNYPNFRVNSDNSGQVQNEEQACISPIDPNVFVAVWRDFRLGYRRVGVGYSHDGGLTWADTLFPQMYEAWQSDPTLVVDNAGVFTANVITFTDGTWLSNLLQVASYDGGVTWQDSVWATYFLQPPGFEDKQMLAVDVSGSEFEGTFYCSWTRFYNYPQTDSLNILVNCKRPGQPYTAPVILSHLPGSVQWSNVCVGSGGAVYVSWIRYDWPAQATYLMLSRSFDGGVTWSQEQNVTAMGFFTGLIDPNLQIFSYGAMAADLSGGPHHGRLYMVLTDAADLNLETDVWLIYSDNHGVTWSPRQTICDEPPAYPVDQFHPWISVDEDGRVWVVFYDRRNDPQNLLMDTFFTVSTDGGQTWRPNERISDVSSHPAAGSLDAGLIGEYIGWQARNGKALAVWTDTRLGNQDVFSAVVDSVFEPTAADGPTAALPGQLKVSAYPNPANNTTVLHYTVQSPAAFTVFLYDLTGRLVRTFDLGNVSAGEYRLPLELSGLATGVYVAELRTERLAARTKLVLLK